MRGYFWRRKNISWCETSKLPSIPTYASVSVTKIGKIPPLWKIFKNLWQGLFGFGQTFQLTLAQFVCGWAHFHCWKWPSIESTIWSSGHTGFCLHCHMHLTISLSLSLCLFISFNLSPFDLSTVLYYLWSISLSLCVVSHLLLCISVLSQSLSIKTALYFCTSVSTSLDLRTY